MAVAYASGAGQNSGMSDRMKLFGNIRKFDWRKKLCLQRTR